MNFKTLTENRLFRPGLGVVLTALCGLVLAKTPMGDGWVHTSYDYLFRFGTRPVTNNVVLILMDNEAYDSFGQSREQPWDRGLHAQLLNRLSADGCSLVVFDSFFALPREPSKDQALAEAMRRQRSVVLMAEQARVTHPALVGAHPTLPAEPFLSAAGTNWGVAWLDPDLDSIVRRHWPFPAPALYPSLPWTAAHLAGASLEENPQPQWLRYYGQDRPWTTMSYRFAFTQPTNFFRDQIVFIGTRPKTTVPDGERDKFCTPYTRWTGQTVGGVEILITSFLNLMNGDWLRRPAEWLETSILVFAGILLGGGLCFGRTLTVCVCAGGAAVMAWLGTVLTNHYGNYWFPWIVVVGGQVPFALMWAVGTRKLLVQSAAGSSFATSEVSTVAKPSVVKDIDDETPDVPDYELFSPPFGKGAYGKVWLARNAIGQWQALKAVYLANFGHNTDPYEREFNGIRRYKPVSDKHSGLLRVDFVSKMKPAGYFYYVMELGDPLEPGWEQEPFKYKPRDLVNERRRSSGQKLPARECVRIGVALADALDFLHHQGLTHRDIKPQNIIFVNNHPKLADVGLISEIRPAGEGTQVGTPGYMPPPPEPPGTPVGDVYALGMVLYVLSTGHNPSYFPEISTTLVGSTGLADFFPLNAVILKACQPDCTQRYASAAEMAHALREAQKKLDQGAADSLAAQA